MNNLIKQSRKLFYGVALSVYAATPVIAADIEIFTDSNSAASTAQPNVMFIMDSSDAMRSTGGGAPVVATYDPATTYPTVNGFDATRIYYTADGVAPTTHNDNETFDLSVMHCDHAVVDYAVGVISTSTETVYTEAGDFEIYKVVTVTGTGTGATRDILVQTWYNNNTILDTSDDVQLSETTLTTNTGDDSVLGVILTETDISTQFFNDLKTVVTISGTGTSITGAAGKGSTRDINVDMDYDTLGDASFSFPVFNTTDADIPVGYGPLLTVGFYSGQLAHVKPGVNPSKPVTWRSLDTNTSAERAFPVECRQDQSIHGDNTTATTTEPHVKTGNGTDYWGNAVDATLIAALWGEVADNFYTTYSANYLNYLQQASPITTTGVSLFDQLKNAIATIVGSASNINIGIMQFDRQLNSTSSVADDGLDVGGDIGDVSDHTTLLDGAVIGGEGAGVQYPAIDVNASRQNFYSNLKVMDASGDAPISEVYYEALRYFGGKKIDYGDAANPPNRTGTKENGNPKNYESPITDSCQKNYIIIVSSGQSTYDYLNKDRRDSLFGFNADSCGNDGGADFVNQGAGFTSADPLTRLSNSNLSASTSTTATNDNCLDELAEWAFTQDVARRDVGEPDALGLGADPADSDYDAAHAGEQNVTTYTVGFAFPATSTAEQAAAEQLLRDTAIKGGGEFVEAADEDELVQVINALLTQILKVNSTFSSPAVSVNAFNRSTHLNDLYFTLFKPDDAEHWTGNLKKYKLAFDADNLPFIADKNGDPAVNDATGFFNETSQSYWSAAIDGDEAGAGGAANLIGNTTDTPVRNVYTITGAYTNTDGVMVPAQPDLNDAANVLVKGNAAVTETLLNIVGHVSVLNDGGGLPIAYRDTLLDWANGQDVFDEVTGSDSRFVMGDPLHAEPALVQYGLISGGVDDGQPDLVSYMATNDGYLHAINSADHAPGDATPGTGGTELWAFVPQEVLPNLSQLLEDDGSEGKIYGLDGSVVAWIEDVDKDGTIESADGDHVYLYFGMRRGLENLQTRNYIYALDVTDRTNPQFMWMIEAGTGEYDELGQTWSTINLEKIKVDTSIDEQGDLTDGEMTVLMFGGGYDLNQDSAVQRSADSKGRAIYFVNAVDGNRLWSAGPPNVSAAFDHDLQLSDMLYSIPSRIKPLDINGDGFIDRLYFGDMGGQLWRFDILLPDGTAATDTLAEIVKGGRIANLAQDASVNTNRRFFFPPDVAFIVEEGQGAYLAILAASGNRAHPLQTDTHDRMYMIRDKNIYEPPASFDYAATEVSDASGSTDLHDATLNLVTEGDSTQIATAVAELADRQGWFIDLSEPDDSSFVGEKALSEPLILSNIAILSSFLPASAGYVSAELCEPNAGTAALYFINIADGTPTYSTTDELGVRGDRRQLLKRGGIPPTPSVIITEDGKPTLCIGTECAEANANLNITKTYWYEVENANATVSP